MNDSPHPQNYFRTHCVIPWTDEHVEWPGNEELWNDETALLFPALTRSELLTRQLVDMLFLRLPSTMRLRSEEQHV